MRLPLDAAGVAAATAACGDAATRWVGWVQAAEEHEARKTMSTLAYDTKARAACAAGAAGSLSTRYGDAGAELAALDAGPVDAGNRGSAMNNVSKCGCDACTRKGNPCERPRTLRQASRMYHSTTTITHPRLHLWLAGHRLKRVSCPGTAGDVLNVPIYL